jgi:DNA-binding LacI/PurR family transcriptional regulator
MNMQPRPGLPSIAVNNRLGGWKATRHLIEQGRQRIGIIRGPDGWWETSERFAGWQDAMQQAGLKIRPERIIQADWSVDSGFSAMQRLLEQAPEIDAVFTCSDDIALGALTAASRLGRCVPQDLALVGFDNIPQSAYFQPPLTTIHQPLARIGRAAVDLLHQQIGARPAGAENAASMATLHEPELVIRASTHPM